MSCDSDDLISQYMVPRYKNKGTKTNTVEKTFKWKLCLANK